MEEMHKANQLPENVSYGSIIISLWCSWIWKGRQICLEVREKCGQAKITEYNRRNEGEDRSAEEEIISEVTREAEVKQKDTIELTRKNVWVIYKSLYKEITGQEYRSNDEETINDLIEMPSPYADWSKKTPKDEE